MAFPLFLFSSTHPLDPTLVNSLGSLAPTGGAPGRIGGCSPANNHQLVPPTRLGHPRLPDEARKRLEARRERDAVFPGQTFLDLGYPKTAFLK